MAIVLGILLFAALLGIGALLWKKYKRSRSAKANSKEIESRWGGGLCACAVSLLLWCLFVVYCKNKNVVSTQVGGALLARGLSKPTVDVVSVQVVVFVVVVVSVVLVCSGLW